MNTAVEGGACTLLQITSIFTQLIQRILFLNQVSFTLQMWEQFIQIKWFYTLFCLRCDCMRYWHSVGSQQTFFFNLNQQPGKIGHFLCLQKHDFMFPAFFLRLTGSFSQSINQPSVSSVVFCCVCVNKIIRGNSNTELSHTHTQYELYDGGGDQILSL